jgi:hypothetical protein
VDHMILALRSGASPQNVAVIGRRLLFFCVAYLREIEGASRNMKGNLCGGHC